MMRTGAKLIVLAAVASLSAGSAAQAATLTQVLAVYQDAKEVALNQPRGLACDAKSLLVVADTNNHRLVRYKLKDRNLSGGEEIKVGQMWSPVRVKLDSKSDIFVLDGKFRRILHLSDEGKFKGYLEPTGLPGSAPLDPQSFEIGSDDKIYVLDTTAWHVAVVDESGATKRVIPLPKGSGVFTDLTVDDGGTVYLLDTAGPAVYSAGKDATSFSLLTDALEELLLFPTTIATDSKGLLFVVDQNGGSVVLLAQQDGSFQGRGMGYGWEEGRLRYPSEFCVNGSGEAFIADRANSRIQIVKVVR